MATILSEKIRLIDKGKETDVNIKHENYAKLKLYEALSDYGSWYIQSYRFTESGLYIKIQKDNEIKRFGFYPVTYNTIYIQNQTFVLEKDIPDLFFYTKFEEFKVSCAMLCASGFYNEYGSY